MNQRAAYPICSHIKTDGRRCQSPAQGVSAFCYHHRNLRRTPKHRPASEISAITQSIAIIAHQASTGIIQHHQASLMLHALQYAANLHATQSK